jgi:calmodulin
MKDSKVVQTYRHAPDNGELQKEFVLVDQDHDGHVNFDEFKRLLEGLDAGMTHTDMQIGFREVDTNCDGFIDCREFIDWWSND